jgi:cell division protein FtsB
MQRVSNDLPGAAHRDAVASGVVPRRQRPRRRTTRFFVLLVTVVLLGNAVVGEWGLIALVRADHQLTAVFQLIESLRAENDDLREEVRMLREDPRKIEELARRELGLMEPGEKVFIVPGRPD